MLVIISQYETKAVSVNTPLKQTTPYDTQEFDDLLIRYVAAVSRQFLPQPTLINGKVVGHSAVKLPNVE